MITRRQMLGAVLSASLIAPARAHALKDVEADLLAKEKYFQPVDQEAPGFILQDAKGRTVKLADFRGKIVVLNFIYTNCPDACPLQSEKIAAIQEMVNISPMKEQMQFISVTTDPKRDNGEVLSSYGENHGLDPANWTFLTAGPDQPESITRDLAMAYGVQFKILEGGEQMHGVLISVIDQNGRLRGRFHGMEFDNLSLVLFANALVNVASERHDRPGPGFWGKIENWFGQ